MTTVVAVDVGGSGLRLVVSRDGAPGDVRRAPGARVGAGGVDVAALASDAVRLLAEEAGGAGGAGGAGSGEGPDAVCWSMRGLLHLADPADVLAAVDAALRPRACAVVSDAVAALVGAVGGLRPGAVVAAGTGAVAFGSDFAGTWTKIDGWGHVLGDRGSAASVGLEGLRAALRSRDGVGGGSARLLVEAEELLGPCDGWPRRVMTGTDAPEALASVAPLVTAAAADGDPVAMGVAAEAGRSLAASLLAAAAPLERPVLVGTGGLLGAEIVHRAFHEAVAAVGPAPVEPLGGALDGALHLAQVLAAEGDVPRHPTYVHVRPA